MYPILFELGSVTIYSLWFFVTCGFIVGSIVFANLCKRNRVSIDLVSSNALVLFLSALIVGRLSFAFLHHELYFFTYEPREWLGLLGLWDKGISFWGALTGFCLALMRLYKKNGQPLSPLLDQLSVALLVGMIFGSIGTFLDGASYGVPTTLPWGMTFRSAYVKYISPIHPTQLYSALYLSVTLVILLRLLSKLRGTQISGFVTELGVLIISCGMFLENFVRGDDTLFIGPIRAPQITALAVAIYCMYRIIKRFNAQPVVDSTETIQSVFPLVQTILKKLHLIKNRESLE